MQNCSRQTIFNAFTKAPLIKLCLLFSNAGYRRFVWQDSFSLSLCTPPLKKPYRCRAHSLTHQINQVPPPKVPLPLDPASARLVSVPPRARHRPRLRVHVWASHLPLFRHHHGPLEGAMVAARILQLDEPAPISGRRGSSSMAARGVHAGAAAAMAVEARQRRRQVPARRPAREAALPVPRQCACQLAAHGGEEARRC